MTADNLLYIISKTESTTSTMMVFNLLYFHHNHLRLLMTGNLLFYYDHNSHILSNEIDICEHGYVSSHIIRLYLTILLHHSCILV